MGIRNVHLSLSEKELIRFIDDEMEEETYLKLSKESIKLLDWLFEKGLIENARYEYAEIPEIIEF